TAGKVFHEEEFAKLGETNITTVDGTMGTAGFVTNVIDEYQFDFHVLYSFDPIPMLNALEDRFKERNGYISLEQRMGSGIGACFAYVCDLAEEPTGAAYVKVCSDGPVFTI